ncbi:MAG TPA: YifB family Mg chelatase-like AAA ATPase [Sporichthyaceae bacterium]|nr:YifB family Mg chelatase-like AAA ATPase [Sporichthyaceae bacterium]
MTGLARSWSVALAGVTGRVVGVEADVGPGLPGFGLIGLPDTALSEARERVRAAVQNSGETWPKQKITVSMSPADLHKRGGGFDLVLALVVLAAAGAVPEGACTDLVVLGELGLDGTVRGLRGVLPAVAAAARGGLKRVMVPTANLNEAALVDGVEVIGVASLRHALAVLRGEPIPEEEQIATAPPVVPRAIERAMLDLVDVRGQAEARRALEVAAAGGHHLFLHGAPGAGKTMLAERLPGLLPELDRTAALEVTEIHSVAGLLPVGTPLVTRAPYARPHHTATTAALVGGGSGELLRPGAASLAHRGVLFLDEAPEFRAGVLDSLRQPMESGEVLLARSGITARFPAAFLLVLAANPCPCGKAVDLGRGVGCSCSPNARRRYQSKISKPLIDRLDLQVFVDRPSRSELVGDCDGESTDTVADRVRVARQRAAHRLAATPWTLNAQVSSRALRRELRIDDGALRVVERALDNGLLSARGMDRVLRVAWSLADLGGRARPGAHEVGTALALRSGVVNGWAA